MLFLLIGLCCLALAGLGTRNYLNYRKRRRSRKIQKIDTLTVCLYIAAAVFLLAALLTAMGGGAPEPTADPSDTGTSDPSGTTEPMETTGPQFGWMQDEGGIYYLTEAGSRATGWLDLENKRYYLDENGYTLSGWQELEGILRYFRPDGSMARGAEEIDGTRRFFDSTGAEIPVANPWNPIAEDYDVELADLSAIYATDGNRVAADIYGPLIEMMDACNQNSGSRCCVLSGYRSREHQEGIFRDKVQQLINEGMSEADARAAAAGIVAVPGTSEHQLGLAVDIIDTQLWALEPEQEDLEAQKWLMEHCWEYGFILRYPKDKTDITGIIYEPWHYRYVGRELAKEITDLGVTLEEYLDRLD